MIERLLTFLNRLPDDKVRHFAGGALIASACIVLGLPLWLAAAAVLIAAFGKEAYDYYHPKTHTPDPLDALATLLGGATVLLPIFLTR